MKSRFKFLAPLFFVGVGLSIHAGAAPFLTSFEYELRIKSHLVEVGESEAVLKPGEETQIKLVMRNEVRELVEKSIDVSYDPQVLPLTVRVDERLTDGSGDYRATVQVSVATNESIGGKSIDVDGAKLKFYWSDKDDRLVEFTVAEILPPGFFYPSSVFRGDFKDYPELKQLRESSSAKGFDARDRVLSFAGLHVVVESKSGRDVLVVTKPVLNGSKSIQQYNELTGTRARRSVTTVGLFDSPVTFYSSLFGDKSIEVTKRPKMKLGFKRFEEAIKSSKNVKELAEEVEELQGMDTEEATYRDFLVKLLGNPDVEARKNTLKKGKALYKSSPEEFARQVRDLGDDSLSEYEVLVYKLGTGKRSLVSLVRHRSTGEQYALKRPLDTSEENRHSFEQEIGRAAMWRDVGVSIIDVKWAPDGTSLLKSYVEGPTLRDVLAEEPEFLEKEGDLRRIALVRVLARLGQTNLYFGDLNSKNLIFDGNEWQVIDSGGVSTKESKQKAAEEYFAKLPEKWMKRIPPMNASRVRKFFEDVAWKALGLEKAPTLLTDSKPSGTSFWSGVRGKCKLLFKPSDDDTPD